MSKNSKVTSLREYKQKKKKNNPEYVKRMRAIKKIKAQRKRFFFVCGSFALVVIIFMHRYSVISNLQYQLQSLNGKLEDKYNEQKQLQIEIDSLSKSGFIEQQAREKLHMEYPTDGQTVYINVD